MSTQLRVRRRGTGASGRVWFPYLLLAPFLLLFAAFFAAPLIYAFRLSLYTTQLIGGQRFVGLAQYTRALRDPQFLSGLLHVAEFGLIYIVVLIVLATAAALILDAAPARFPRVAIFMPYAVPSAVGALMWGYLYSQDFGPAVSLLKPLGLPAPNFLSPGLVIFALVNIVLWQFVGYNMMILYVALGGISRDLYEAATVDGASPRKIAWRIKIPLLRPALLLVSFFSFIGSLQLFTEPQILSANAPNVVNYAYTPNLYVYNLAFSDQELSYSAAISFTVGFVAVAIAVIFLVVSRRTAR